jgi:hypothetical protein
MSYLGRRFDMKRETWIVLELGGIVPRLSSNDWIHQLKNKKKG